MAHSQALTGDVFRLVADDFSLDLVYHWKHDWTHYASMLPPDYGVVQLAFSHPQPALDTIKKHNMETRYVAGHAVSSEWAVTQTIATPRWSSSNLASVILREPVPNVRSGFYGTTCYLVSRKGAQEIIEALLMPDGRWNLKVWLTWSGLSEIMVTAINNALPILIAVAASGSARC